MFDLKYYFHLVKPIKTVKVQVRQGVVVGREERLPNGEPYNVFQGIPYALPPLGNLRFQPPVPLEKFETPELDCTKMRECSWQRDRQTKKLVGTEDCLHLNIYGPVKPTIQILPVMVWIHGGGFSYGHGQEFLPLSLMMEDIIVVSINYRLGVLGFGCLPEAGIWGNAGLKDQRQALRWVQENIVCFNGDPGNITLIGQGAGGVCVSLHTLGCHANKLFHKAIMQSGTANQEWAFQRSPQEKMYRLNKLFGCASNDPRKMPSPIEAPTEAILSKTNSLLLPDERRRSIQFPLGPVLEDSNSPDPIVSTPVLDRMCEENAISMPTIMGYNSAEGISLIGSWLEELDKVDKDLERFLPRNIPLPFDHPQMKELTHKLRKAYFGGGRVTHENIQGLADILADYIYISGIKLATKMHATHQPNAPLYAYRFHYTGERDVFRITTKFEHLKGACHGDELFYIFQTFDDDVSIFDPADIKIIKQICAMWANFARHGDPTPKDSDITKELGFRWTPVRKPIGDDSGQDYLNIDYQSEMIQDPDKARADFWFDIYNEYAPRDYSILNKCD
ncbi:unnamed protein product [Ceratitis capitata]|uniref:(Mediterranean fruit fly) hypothetical protein n=1 Tax=Ceratitis capitata TaxID=7213 RepID=A0A811VJM8_CERCA|nr:unnamed protein product [Ceratitis capitata]